MKSVFAFICAVCLFSSCAGVKSPVTGFVYTDTKNGQMVTSNALGTKVGQSSAISVLGIVGVGDASIQAAAKQAGITKISHVDEAATNVLCIYAKYTTTVYGE